ncbi:MAG TPA: CBS domain-containing protein [Nitrospiria bacterium]|nr:CBS domain-containing protein [Nitrospiria bacterium]
MPLSDFCKGPVFTVSPEDTAFRAGELMRDHRIGCLVVTKEDRPIGLLTDRDLVVRVMTERKDPLFTQVRDIMSMNPVVAAEGLGINDVIRLMKTHAIRRIPVVSGDGKLVGIITMDDLIGMMGTEMAGMGDAIIAELGQRPVIVT